MPEANYLTDGLMIDWTPTAAVSAGEVIHLPDGRAAFAPTAIAAGVQGAVQVSGICSVAKTTSMVMLKGSQVFWDVSASKAHLLQANNTNDYYLGIVMETAASAGTTVKVSLNQRPQYTLSLAQGYTSAQVSTAGWPQITGAGNSVNMKFDLTAEAQKLDALSCRSVATGTVGILSALICVNTNGDDAAFDLNVGLADATHASDADQITSSLFCHVDGNNANINFESDNAAAEVSATDSTVDLTAGTPFLVQWDLTDWTDIQVYVDGVNVLPASVFTLSGVAGPLKLLAHMEKSSNDTPGNVTVMDLGFTAFDV